MRRFVMRMSTVSKINATLYNFPNKRNGLSRYCKSSKPLTTNSIQLQGDNFPINHSYKALIEVPKQTTIVWERKAV